MNTKNSFTLFTPPVAGLKKYFKHSKTNKHQGRTRIISTNIDSISSHKKKTGTSGTVEKISPNFECESKPAVEIPPTRLYWGGHRPGAPDHFEPQENVHYL